MKGLFRFYLLVCLSTGTFGCASSYRRVLVSVVDSNTRQPVAGATVSTSYPAKSSLFRLLHPSSRTVTDLRGEAVLKVNCERTFGPLFDVVVVNEQYDQHLGYSESLNEWMNRPKEFIPTKPDVVLEVISRKDEKRAEEELEAKHKSDDLAAERLFRESPNFWPEHNDDPYPFPKTDIDQRLIWKRWERASKTALGSNEDIDSIRAAVVRHMKHPQPKVGEIKWISPSVVMVSSSWYSGPLAAAGYTYVLQKDDSGWKVLEYYMNFIS